MTPNSTIPKGFVLKARKIEDSAIAHASPCTRELWDLILRKANYHDRKCGKTTIKRGQWLTTYEEIQDLLHWRVGFRKVVYSWHQIEAAMKYMRSGSMVTTAKATRGLFITILNYDLYQRLESYERHNEDHNEDHDNATLKRRNGKNVSKEGTFVPPTPAQVDEYAALIDYSRPGLGRDFCEHYEATHWRLTNGKPMTNWKLSVQTWRRTDEKNPRPTTGPSLASDIVAPVVRGPDGLTPRERALAQMEAGK